MKWLGLLAVFALIGCQEVGNETLPSAALSDQDVAAAVSKEKKTFSHAPAKLEEVLAKLRKDTGWKITCRPELANELVYLKFKDKDEVQVARVLMQILACEGDLLDGALTLFVHDTHPQIGRSVFQEDVYNPRIRAEIDALQKTSSSMGFQPGTAQERIEKDIALLNEIEDFKTPENERILQTISPGQRTIITMMREAPLEVLMDLKRGKPAIWSTAPQAGELKMTKGMEDRLNEFILASMEWNGALQAAKSANKLHDKMPWPISFNPRGDFVLMVERGGNQIIAGRFELTCRLATVKGPAINELAGVGIPLDRVKMKPSGKSYPNFDREIERLQKDYKSGKVLETVLLQKALEESSEGGDNIAANLETGLLQEMGMLIWPRARVRKPSGNNPEAILLDNHNKGLYEGFTTYRPHFVNYVRLDRQP